MSSSGDNDVREPFDREPFSIGSVATGLALRRLGALCAILAIFGAVSSAPTQAADPTIARGYEGASTRSLVVTLYKSRTIHVDRPFATAVVGAPDIADALPMTDRGLYIQGKKIGTTNVSVFDSEQKLVTVIDLEVALDNRDL